MKCTLRLTLSLICLLPGVAAAHAEHDKPRYVAEQGEDTGRCDKTSNPCKTIGYAAQQASKGDTIQVASGSYTVDDIDTLFSLISNVVPVKGGYSAKFKGGTNTSTNPTRLVGVPLEYADELTQKGFTVIIDRKGLSEETQQQLAHNMALLDEMRSVQTDQPCSEGYAARFPCSKLDLVAHMPLLNLANAGGGNDIWGHIDLNDGREYALMGLNIGTAIVDISTAESPRLVSHIPGDVTVWRDIKVLQTYIVAEQRWKSYAYVTADNANIGLQIIDLNSLPEQATLVNADKTDLSAHNVYLSNVDYSTGVPLTGMTPYLHLAGSNNQGGAFNTYALTSPAAPARIYRHAATARENYSHDVASMAITDERKDSQCVNATDHCEILFDFNENDVRLWDKTNNQTPAELSRTSYPQASYVHSGWWSEDKLIMLVHDELDEQKHGLNTTLRLFDIADLTQPVLLSTYTGPTRAIDHNGFVRGNRYYMSNYERGLTVLDISDPSNPRDAGFFDTFPNNNNASFNGAWGTYPFLLSGLVLISDINSGLFIVRDQTLAVPQGSFELSAARYRADEGSLLSIDVMRTSGSIGAVSVDYETQIGSADTGDFTLVSGRLEWADGESESKSFTIPILIDELTNEIHESFFVRLLNPHGGATLSNPRQSIVYINGLPTPGRISLLDTNITMANTAESVTVRLIRTGGFEGNTSVELALDEAATTTLNLSSNNLSWADGESGAKSVTLSLAPGTTRSNQVFTLSLAGDHLSSADPITTSVTLSASPLTSPPAPTPTPTSPPTTPTSGGKSGGGSATWLLLGLLGCLMGRLRKTSAIA